MNKQLLVALALAIPLGVAGFAQADLVFATSGSYLVSDGVSYLFLDACGTGGLTEGIDSNCFAVPASVRGLPYQLAMSGIGVLEPLACFYDGGGDFIDCGAPVVPGGAAEVSISSLTGVNVGWTFSVST